MGKVDVHFYKVWTGISSFYKVIIQIQILQRCYAALYFCLCSCRSSTAPAISSKWARKILNFCFILRKTFIEAVRGGGGPSHIQSDKLFIPPTLTSTCHMNHTEDKNTKSLRECFNQYVCCAQSWSHHGYAGLEVRQDQPVYNYYLKLSNYLQSFGQSAISSDCNDRTQ